MTRKILIASSLLVCAFGVVLLGASDALAQAVPTGPSIEQYTGSTRWPAVAYDSANGVYLVVWGNGTIRGKFIDDTGTAVGSVFTISDPSPNAQAPRVAYSPDASAFLVVWHSTDGVTGYADGTRVRGRMVSFTEGVSTSPTQVYSNGDYTTRWEVGPAVAYSSSSQTFLVAYNIFSATGAEVGARLVDATAAPVGSEIAVTASAGDYDREPSVGYFPSTDSFVVAWSGSGSSSDYVRARLFAASDGTALGSVVTIGQSTYTYVPDVALNRLTGQMFIVWIQNDPAGGGWRPFGTFMDDAGTIVGSTTRLSSTVGAYDANSVAYNVRAETFFLVTHGSTEQDFGFEITNGGLPVAAATAVTSVTAPGLTGSFNPRIGASELAPGWLIGTAASFSSLWTQLITGTDLGGGGGTVTRKLSIIPQPTGGTVTGGGLTCGTGGTTCQVTFQETTSVTLTATPDDGSAFLGWGGSCTGTATTTTIEVSTVKTCRATFAAVWGGPGTEPAGCLAAPTPSFSPSPGPIGTSVNQYTGATQYPDVAYDKCQQVYLVVWSLGGTIRGRFISEDGVGLGDTFYVSTGQFAQSPKVVYNPNLGNFLVVWHSSATDSRTEVRSTIVTYPPGPASYGTVLSASTYSSRWITRPAIGYSTGSGRYLVAWSRYASSGADISARLVDTLNAPVADEFPVSSTTEDYDREPTAGYFPAANRFLVAWAGSGSTTDFVRGRLFDAGTGASYGSSIQFGQSTYTYVPEAPLNTVTGNIFLVWMQTGNGGFRPYGRFVDSEGTLATGATLLSSTAGAYDANAIDYNPLSKTFFLVTHGSTEQDVGFEIGGEGAALGSASIVTSITWPALNGSFNPRLAASVYQPRWLISTAAAFQSMWTQLVGGTDPGTGSPVYRLTISPTPSGGTVTGGSLTCGTGGTTCQETFASATTVNLTATAATNYVFTSWGGACSGTSTTTSVLVDAAKTCSATFTSTGGGTTYQLSISPTPVNGTVSGGGLSCGAGGSVCQVTVPASTSVTLSASAASGYSFTSWGGSCTGTAPTTTVLMDAAKSCTATFTAGLPSGPPYTMTISPRPTGGTVTGAALNCGTATSLCTASMPASMPYGMQATPDAGYTFSGWTGDCTGTTASLTVQLAGPRTCGATFTPTSTPTYRLTISPTPTGGTVSGGGIGCGTGGGTCQVTYANIASITLTAAPDSGYLFSSWGGACSGTGTSTTVQVDGLKTCSATFVVAPTYRLTVSPAPTGGTVTGGGLTCGTGGTTCQATYGSSTSVTLTAAPDSGNAFTSWGGSCTGTSTSTTVQVDSVKTCSATFASTSGPLPGPPYTMTISPRPTGGTVTGAALNCGTATSLCTASMPASMPYGMQATPDAGYTFSGWTGDCTGTSASLTIQLGGPRTCGATFTSTSTPTYRLTVSPTPTGGTVSGGGLTCGTGGATCQATYGSSTSVTLTAAPDSGYAFTSWGGSCAGTSTSTTVQVDGLKTCSATFTSTSGPLPGPPYTMTISPRPTGGTVTGAALNCGTATSLCTASMPASMPYGMQATPDAGYTFGGWTGDCTGTSASLTIQLGGPRTCGATFTSTSTPTYRLTVSPTPTGGTVSGGGLTCGTGGTTCQATYGSSTSVTLTAAPDSGYAFTSWGGSCTGTSTSTTVQVDSVKTCSATFTSTSGPLPGPPYTMTISPRPTGGTVTGAALNCGTATSLCTASMPASMPYGMQATPDAGYTFGGWTGDCTGTSASLTIQLGGPRTCGAIFTPAGGGS